MRSTLLSSFAALAATFVAGGGRSPADQPKAAVVQDAAAPRTSSRDFEIDRAPDGLFYLRASVGGTPIDFAVDSGASVVVLTSADADRLGLPRNTPEVRASTAAGSTTMRRVHIDRLDVAGHVFNNVDAVVADRGVTMSLLGQSALSRFEAVTFMRDKARFE